ncbi:MAG: tetratricopeptide repeat protein [Oscillospiraceae bacterium]|nr:tetratricopeptide repeat protein [Oscillospiraceae bacterium]
MDWKLLGIEPTRDKKAITAAYRAKLRQTNPEDKPEEFKALRTAYEEALRLAQQEDTVPARDESPVGLWIEKVQALYADFSARIRPENWRKLLSDDVCVGLDTRPLAEDALLRFLMQDYFVPQCVWQVLDAVFEFTARAEELCETYPRDFIEHAVLNGIRFSATLPYDLYEPGVNAAECDALRRLYHQACNTPSAQHGDILEQMEAFSEYHPYCRALRLHWMMENGQKNAAVAGYRDLAQAYPGDAALNMDWANVCMDEGDLEEAERVARHILDANSGHIHAKRILAECLAAKSQYEQAKELLYELLHAGSDDPIFLDQMAQRMRAWNEALIVEREEAWKRDPSDSDNAIELVWCYMQNERLDDALDFAQQIDPACADQFAYHNLMGKLFHNLQMSEQALPHLQKAEQILRDLSPDGTQKTEKRIHRYPEMLQIVGNCLMQLGRSEEAKDKFEQALAIAPEDPEMLSMMGKILFSTGDLEQCVYILEKLNQISPGRWFTNVILSMALFRLHRDREAFDAINRALSVQGGDLSLYVIKMQILLRNGVFEEVHAILDFLKEAGAPEDISLDWIRAQLTEFEDKNEKKAFKQYQTIARKIEAGADMLDASSLYYRMTVLMGDQMNANKPEDRDILMTMLEKGLAADKFHEDCLSYKAWLLKKADKLDEAIEMYRSLKTPAAEMKLAELYYQDLNHYAAEALACYEAMLRKRQTPELYFYAATCKRHMGDYEGARRYYQQELALDPMDVDGYNGLAFVCEAQGRYEDALEQVCKGVSVMWETENFYAWLVEHQIQVLRRLGRFADALAAADDAMSRGSYDGWQTKFDICCQAGLWDQAKVLIDQWKKADRGNHAADKAAATLNLLTGKMFMATLAMGRIKRMVDFEEEQDFRLTLADLECNHKRQIQIWARRAGQDPASDHALMSLALAQWWNGDRSAARENAQTALNLIDEILKQNLVDKALFRSRRSVLLAILGRPDEARAELALVRTLPLCQHCSYGRCKDADIFEGYIEEIAGDTAKAAALYRAGRKNWPDELDFASGEARLKKKGK